MYNNIGFWQTECDVPVKKVVHVTFSLLEDDISAKKTVYIRV